ncbi:nucleotidyltransferase family protein [Alcaligenaceae bacterium SJ-26]|nr:nucleotidyltransferase family protein [Alcaligenaceae bacterium SJ-26]
MRAMILAAGRGERMRPLTDHTPKPLLTAGGRPLIEWQITRLAQAGIRDIVINLSWLGERIEATLGDGQRLGVHLHYSYETEALETAGGIRQALPLLGADPFLVVNGDVWCDWDYAQASPLAAGLTHDPQSAANTPDAWLLLTTNPEHHRQGDFSLTHAGKVTDINATRPDQSLTFTGIGIYHPRFFDSVPSGQRQALGPLLRAALAQGKVIGQRHEGQWLDIGTPARLAALDRQLTLPQQQSPDASML